jgi:hypothetical protein
VPLGRQAPTHLPSIPSPQRRAATSSTPLKLCRGVYVRDLMQFVVKGVAEISSVLAAGKRNRAVGATMMNQARPSGAGGGRPGGELGG